MKETNEWFKTTFIRHLKKAWDKKMMSLSRFVSLVFRTKQRSIMTMQCLQDVQLRGAVWVDSKPVDGLIERRVLQMRKGQYIWIREDEDEDFVTIENSRGVVNIGKREWNYDFKKFFEYRHRDNDAGSK